MVELSLSERLQKRFILFTSDASLIDELGSSLPDGWRLVTPQSLEELGDWAAILLHRFILLDLDDGARDPHALIKQLRYEMQVNIPVFCFGGDKALQDKMRSDRADRMLTREELPAFLLAAYEQYGWG